MKIIGIKSNISYLDLLTYFKKQKFKFVLLNSLYVYNSIHIQSAFYHTINSFSNNNNTSDDFCIEFLLFLSGTKNISKALSIMNSENKKNEYILIIFEKKANFSNIPSFIGYINNNIIKETTEKSKNIILENNLNLNYENLILELVALTKL